MREMSDWRSQFASMRQVVRKNPSRLEYYASYAQDCLPLVNLDFIEQVDVLGKVEPEVMADYQEIIWIAGWLRGAARKDAVSYPQQEGC